MNYLVQWFLAFSLTNIIEFIPFYFFLRGDQKERILVLLKVNLVTHPLLWLVLPLFFDYYLIALLLLEILIIISETLLLKSFLKIGFTESAKISVVMNMLSAVLGLFLF